ncbi:glucose/ribitol dehydrogenase [Scheffersomyces amazonensis]|uniref:glucose/ribitol dehydrogenase n=1 Tax=Scheffersomyces amazonensis TaxID=1078765 RepID=UPI00315D3FC7
MSHVTILTGASRGIGKAIAEILLTTNDQTKLIAVARSGDNLKDLEEKYGSDRVGIVIGDVAEQSTTKAAIDLAIKKFGQINSVIANAGVLDPVGPIEQTDLAKWKRLYDINLFAVVDIIQQSLPELKKTNGNIIAVSSGASLKPYNAWYAYGSSKAALNHLIASVAEEETDIQSISIAPGVVDTAMQQDIRNVFGKKMAPDALSRFTDLHKNNQLLKPETPATVYVNLAIRGWSKEVNGTYLRFDDKSLVSYTK